ncbi:mechanosensitive ion channel family protein [Pengzhenrongella sicca]|uniref:Mechanosensitive ion channel family protein n=1 Tax=Pengzhenrongella sicca TaxID=2819238 RepID=A0A8A4ZLL0_9MICO|nr:mechanosensitive ion channel family protein [Pengzhenrongella sicca]QTE30448.1 mechanosensitive ion channel family protein [Pengzhenrongella sicca]
MFVPTHALSVLRSRALSATDPSSGPTTPATSLQENLDSTARWFDALIQPAWQIALILVIGAIALALLRRFISRTVRHLVEGGPAMSRRAGNVISRGLRQDGAQPDASPLAAARRAQRAQTMGSALSSAATFLVGALVIVLILGILNVDVGPLLASAGVVGVALGFGAQTLVKDFLAGISMLAEDQYGVGDVVDVGEASGVVEQVGLRVTQIRSLNGTLWYVRNGEILRVGNMTQGWSRAVVEVRVLADQDVPRVQELLLQAAAEVAADADLGPALLDDAEVAGIEDLTAEGAMLRLLVKTAPSLQWDVARALRARIRLLLAAEGIDLALARREVVVERDRPPHVLEAPTTASSASTEPPEPPEPPTTALTTPTPSGSDG